MPIRLAPVSTMKCTARPLIAPCAMKWPPLPAVSTMRLPLACPPPLPPTLAGASPTRSVWRFPPISTTAWSPEVETTLTPWCVSPGATVLGAAPSTISKALEPSMPCNATDCANAPRLANRAAKASKLRRGVI